jgi:hypothetical protein
VIGLHQRIANAPRTFGNHIVLQPGNELSAKVAKVFWFFFSKKNFFLKKEAKTFAALVRVRGACYFTAASWT